MQGRQGQGVWLRPRACTASTCKWAPAGGMPLLTGVAEGPYCMHVVWSHNQHRCVDCIMRCWQKLQASIDRDGGCLTHTTAPAATGCAARQTTPQSCAALAQLRLNATSLRLAEGGNAIFHAQAIHRSYFQDHITSTSSWGTSGSAEAPQQPARRLGLCHLYTHVQKKQYTMSPVG